MQQYALSKGLFSNLIGPNLINTNYFYLLFVIFGLEIVSIKSISALIFWVKISRVEIVDMIFTQFAESTKILVNNLNCYFTGYFLTNSILGR